MATLTSPVTPAAPPAPQRPRRRRRMTTGRALTYTVLVVGVAAWLLPFAWMVLGSVKTQREILTKPPTWWPQNPTLDNFGTWFDELHFTQYFTNSFVVAVVTVLGNLLF